MANYTVVYDACVFYSLTLRDLLIQLATTQLFCARWSAAIHREWIEALSNKQPKHTKEQLGRLQMVMDRSVPDCLVTGYESLVSDLKLPDPQDRHVLAAAIRCGAQAIITNNLKDFPREILQSFDIEALSPDSFVSSQLDMAPGAVIQSVAECRKRLCRPAFSVEEYLQSLTRHGLVKTVAALRVYQNLV